MTFRLGNEGVNVVLPCIRLPSAKGLPLPLYLTAGAAGMDIYAAIETPLVMQPGSREIIGCGIKIAVPSGFEAQIRPRSGLALRHGVTVLNAPGTIDCDYRGEIQVVLINLGTVSYTIQRGDRIAQLVISPVVQATLAETDKLPDSSRNEGGFGHTGT